MRALVGERDLVRFSGLFEPARVHRLFAGDGIAVLQADETLITLALEDASQRLPAIIGALTGAGGEIRSTTLSQPSLESLFIKLTGKQLRE